MICYKYTTEKSAQDAVAALNTAFGFPKAGQETTTYCNYFKMDDYWFIIYTPEMKEYLGEPVEIQIKIKLP